MQTFLPYPDFRQSAATLDNSRLGNQCYRECKTLLSGGWKHHPAAKMWLGHERSMCDYALALVNEMECRQRWKPEVITRWRTYYSELRSTLPNTGPPSWLGNAEFHASHRSNLLRKDPEHYSQFGWQEPNDLEYVWPVGDLERDIRELRKVEKG
jgi:hypothetical protein